MQEEIFGPIMPLLKYSHIQEVVDYINRNEKPLAMYYFGQQSKNLLRDSTSSGAFVQNEACFQVINFEIPFGGVGNSGSGCMNTQAAFDGCSHVKAVLEKGNINCFPFSCRFPPYTPSKVKTWKTLVSLIGIKKQNSLIKKSLLAIFLLGLLVAVSLINKKYSVTFSLDIVKK